MTLRIFGQLQDVIGTTLLNVENIKDTDTLIQHLQIKYPAIKNMKYKVAVNKNIIQSNTDLHQDFEIALLPPFSGG